MYLERQRPDVVYVPDELAYVHDVIGGQVGDVADVDVALVRRGDGRFLLRLGAGPVRASGVISGRFCEGEEIVIRNFFAVDAFLSFQLEGVLISQPQNNGTK